MVSHLDTLISRKPASHPPRSALARLQTPIVLYPTMPKIVLANNTRPELALHKGVGDSGIVEAAGGEFFGGYDGGVSTRGESDVERDVGFGSQSHGIEGGDEKACEFGRLVQRILLALWCRFVVLVSQRGICIVLRWSGWQTGCDYSERVGRGAHQVSNVGGEVAPSCVAWFPIVIVGLLWRKTNTL